MSPAIALMVNQRPRLGLCQTGLGGSQGVRAVPSRLPFLLAEQGPEPRKYRGAGATEA